MVFKKASHAISLSWIIEDKSTINDKIESTAVHASMYSIRDFSDHIIIVRVDTLKRKRVAHIY